MLMSKTNLITLSSNEFCVDVDTRATTIVAFTAVFEVLSIPDPHLLILGKVERLAKVGEDEFFR